MTFLLKFPNKASFVNKLKPNNVILLPGTERYKFSYIYNLDYNPSGNTKNIYSLILII